MTTEDDVANWPVLYIEDEEDQVEIVRHHLTRYQEPKFTIYAAHSLRAGTQDYGQERYKAILFDLGLPDNVGLNGLEAIKAAYPDCPVIVVTTRDDIQLGRQSLREGAHDFLVKNVTDGDQLRNAIVFAAERQAIRSELAQKNTELIHALEEIKTLYGLICICSVCKRIRTDDDTWEPVEVYVRDHTEADFSHGYCPECYTNAKREIDES